MPVSCARLSAGLCPHQYAHIDYIKVYVGRHGLNPLVSLVALVRALHSVCTKCLRGIPRAGAPGFPLLWYLCVHMIRWCVYARAWHALCAPYRADTLATLHRARSRLPRGKEDCDPTKRYRVYIHVNKTHKRGGVLGRVLWVGYLVQKYPFKVPL